METLDELAFVLSREHGELGMRILHRIERPIHRLCMDAGVPEAYERLRMVRDRREMMEPESVKRISEPSIQKDTTEPRR